MEQQNNYNRVITNCIKFLDTVTVTGRKENSDFMEAAMFLEALLVGKEFKIVQIPKEEPPQIKEN